MSYKPVAVENTAKGWFKNPKFVEAYDALEEESALASALIEARGRANLTQEEVAARMGTTQTAVARLESGRSNPSTRTLERYAKATGHRLRLNFVPTGKAGHEKGL